MWTPKIILWITMLLFTVHRIQAGYKAATITCECSTTHCLGHDMKYCNTTGMCFSQYLDRHDGSHPVVRGCIKSKTPLLCENRRPAIVKGTWPLLLCCNSNLCNRDVVPTPPPWFVENAGDNGTLAVEENKTLGTIERDGDYRKPEDPKDSITSSAIPEVAHEETPAQLGMPNNSKSRSSSLPHIISPVYISVLVLGIISLIVIGIVAAIVLKRSNQYYMEQYGALEHQHEQSCLKNNMEPYEPSAHVHCDCDSVGETLSQCSQPYIQVIYPHNEANDT